MITQKTEMVCIECGHHFKKTITARTLEITCPKCQGVDVEVA